MLSNMTDDRCIQHLKALGVTMNETREVIFTNIRLDDGDFSLPAEPVAQSCNNLMAASSIAVALRRTGASISRAKICENVKLEFLSCILKFSV